MGLGKPRVFPDPKCNRSPEGLIAVSKGISSPILIDAYSHGIFPWPVRKDEILWFSPRRRGILRFSELHISARLKRFLKRRDFTLRINHNFKAVLEACATSPRPEEGTWITSDIVASFLEFHRLGYAHSFEAYNARDELVGGLYGVAMDRFFGGESMFFRTSGASKFAFLGMVATLKNLGLQWIDTQMTTPITASFGARYISRGEFLPLLRQSVQNIEPIATATLRKHIGDPVDML